MPYSFISKIGLGPTLQSFGVDAVRAEPMLFNCDADAAYRLGGPITHAFLEALICAGRWDDHEPIVIDSRVHMLMPGWYPCIPGWHHDDVPRTRIDGQPNYESAEYKAEHAMAMVGGDICPTEFALGVHSLPVVPLGGVVYREWHPIVEQQVRTSALRLWSAPTGQLVFFDSETMHQGTRATRDGWRWFVRASRRTGRKPTNELRRQVQVYLERPMDGW